MGGSVSVTVQHNEWGKDRCCLEHVGPRTLSDSKSGPGALALGVTTQTGTRNDKELLGLKTAGCFEWTGTGGPVPWWEAELSSCHPRGGPQPPVTSAPGRALTLPPVVRMYTRREREG